MGFQLFFSFIFKWFSTFQIDTFIKSSSSSPISRTFTLSYEKSRRIFMHPEIVQCQTKRLKFESLLFSKTEYFQYFFFLPFGLSLAINQLRKSSQFAQFCMFRARFLNKFSSLNTEKCRFIGTCGPDLCIVNRNIFCFVDGNEILPNCHRFDVFILKTSFCIKRTQPEFIWKCASTKYFICWLLLMLFWGAIQCQ